MRVLLVGLILLSLVTVLGCGGGSGGSRSPIIATGSIEGYVYATTTKSLVVRANSRAVPAGQQPLVGAIITVRAYPALRATSNDQGYFRMDNVPSGPQVITISGDGYAHVDMTVQVAPNVVTPVAPPPVTPAQYKWTVLVYMAADNNLESQGLADFNEMEQVGSTNDVKVLVQFDRPASHYTSSLISTDATVNGLWSGARRYEVVQDADTNVMHSTKLEDLGSTDMGQPGTLHDFIVWGQRYAPADHYLVVLWDHGSGWDPTGDATRVSQRAIGLDQTSGNDIIRDIELPAALSGLNHLDIVATDACLMGMFEVAYEIRNQTDYLVASEEETPTDGFAYQELLGKLTSSEGLAMTPAQFAVYMGHDAYNSWVGPQINYYYATSSVLDLSKIGNVATAVSNLAQRLSASPVLSGYPTQLTDASLNAERFSFSSSYAFADLYDYAGQLINRVPDSLIHQDAANLQSAVQSVVIGTDTAGGHPNAHGLSIYFPGPSVYRRVAITNYPLLQSSKDTYWDDWLALQPAQQ